MLFHKCSLYTKWNMIQPGLQVINLINDPLLKELLCTLGRNLCFIAQNKFMPICDLDEIVLDFFLQIL